MRIERLLEGYDYMRQSAVTVLIMCLQLTFIMAVKAVNAGCDCILFDDTYGKEFGVFTSPNFPVPYDESINCLLYTFTASPSEIVEITFDEFDIQRNQSECSIGDYIKLFLHLESNAVNEYTPWSSVLCGKVTDIEQVHYSSGSSLILEFHSDVQRGNNTGFRGTYRFLNKELYRIDGELLHGSYCDYQFISSRSIKSHGKFYSPRYPSTYPLSTKCAYHFMGKYNERVRVVFDHVRFNNEDTNCFNSPEVILVHDGNNQLAPLIGQVCSTNPFAEILSTGPDVYIEFKTKIEIPKQGFKASYYFEETEDKSGNSGIKIFSTEPEKKGDNPHPVTYEPEPVNTFCEEWITSDASKSGAFTSPNYPDPYAPGSHCVYHLVGRGKERVQLTFTEFELYKPDDVVRECESVDSVSFFINNKGRKEKLDEFCVIKLPEQLMSNGPHMTVEFSSLPSSAGAKGFRALYKFVTNFGIHTGRPDSRTVCGFVYNSSKESNGTFTSPNWPGNYPRDTECHYFFYGRNQEKIRITFTHFDVEGVIPCTAETASDYLEFTSYQMTDRKLARHCGLKKPQIIDSDDNYFQITFKSNDRFDGSGFEAFYEFRSSVDAVVVNRVRNNGGFLLDASVWLIIVSFVMKVISAATGGWL